MAVRKAIPLGATVFIRKMTLCLIGLTRLIMADFWAWTLFCLIWAYDGPFV